MNPKLEHVFRIWDKIDEKGIVDRDRLMVERMAAVQHLIDLSGKDVDLPDFVARLVPLYHQYFKANSRRHTSIPPRA